MRQSVSSVRVLSLALLAATTVAATSGCSWFHKKGPRGDYALAPEMRPLEVPPDLNLPDTSGAMQIPALASASQQGAAGQQAPQPSRSGFIVSGEKDAVFDQLGKALGDIDGVTIASKAQMLGSYDVSYKGASFLVRVAATESGSYVSALDPRGLPATGEAPVALIAELKAKLAN